MARELFDTVPDKKTILGLMQPDYEIDSLEDLLGLIRKIEG
jgi:hypothetical protein